MKSSLLAISLSFFALLQASAQESTGYIHRPFQVSFIAPVGSNGIDGKKVVNNFSFNILSGYAAGLEGVEIGGLVNLELDYANGLQIAGLTNVVRNQVKGAQIGGILNYAGKDSKAAQIGGIANIVTGYQKGIQIGGITNYNHGLKGLQVAGIASVSIGHVDGLQLTGITNIAREVDGAQISGIVNMAKSVKGFQLSLINIADTVDGVSIGFINFIAKGYRKLEISANESVYLNAAFKTGTSRFYNIFSAGFRPGDTSVWTYGYGVGTELNKSGKLPVNIDLSSHNLQRISGWQDQMNLLNRLDVTMGWKLSENATVFAGPSLNVYVFHYSNPSESTPINIAPYTLSNDISGKSRIQTWIGFKAGVRLF